MEKARPFDCCCSHRPRRRHLSTYVKDHGGHSEHTLWCFAVQCVNLMFRIF